MRLRTILSGLLLRRRVRIARLPLGCADFRTQKIPTKLAHLSVNGTRPLAIAQWVSAHGVIAREFVDARLVGSGIGDAGTGIVGGVCLCWWNAEGCQCYHRCRRRAN